MALSSERPSEGVPSVIPAMIGEEKEEEEEMKEAEEEWWWC